MRFRDRADAADRLAQRLVSYRGGRPLVLGLPRGGVPMARTIADALDGDIDVVLVRKLAAPGQPELAIGAVDEHGAVFEGRYLPLVPPDYVREEVRIEQEILRKRRERYARAHPAVDPAGRVVIVVDDGLATGSSMLAALRAVRARKPARLVVAVAVAPPSSLARVQAEADEVVCLYTTDAFDAVGQFFEDFSQVSDEMVVTALEARRPPGAIASSPR